MTPITLSNDELTAVLQRVAPNGKEYGAARIARLLAGAHSVLSVRINAGCSVSNISDLISKSINPQIADLGLYVACTKPHRRIRNKFGQSSGMMLWSFYRDSAANDPAYLAESLEDALRRDLSAVQAEFSLDPPPSPSESVDAWETVLKGMEPANDAEGVSHARHN